MSTRARGEPGNSTAEPSPVPGPITSTGPGGGAGASMMQRVSAASRNWVA